MEKKCTGKDPRERRFLLSRADEYKHGGLVALINQWPTGNHPAQLVAAAPHVEDLYGVVRYKMGRDACITAHTTTGSPVCVLVAHSLPDVVRV